MLKPFSNQVAEFSVIYEANIRQYSVEGTFRAFTEDIPQLKKLGIKILWVMPIQPISFKKRKATPDKSIEEIQNPEEKKKYLGSYYSIADYTAINPEFGTMEDFKELIKTAHENGIYVILDWVANHTGWDHNWILHHPEFYHKNQKGDVTDPMNYETGESWGWNDVAHLDFRDPESGLYDAMIEEMTFWIKETNIDGFRCDMADLVDTRFWELAIPKLKEMKSIFMLAESNKNYLFNDLFDMEYGWETHHLLNDIAVGKKNVHDFYHNIWLLSQNYQRQDYFMNFTSNHDENSWQNTEYERMGDAVEIFAALTYLIPGMPLIYNGQEYDSKVQLKFFEKDCIEKTKGKMWDVYVKLGKLKNENPALNGAKDRAEFDKIQNSDETYIMLFKREKNEEIVYFLGNFSSDKRKFKIEFSGKFQDYMMDREFEISENKEIELMPWAYKILVRKF